MLKKITNFVLGGLSVLLISIVVNAMIGAALAIQIDQENIGTGYMTQPSLIYPSFQPIIRLERQDGVLCSGVVIDTQYALTAAHCVTGDWGLMYKKPIDILDQFGVFTDTKAIAVALDTDRDIALIKANFEAFQSMPLFEETTITNPVLSCGFPGGGNMYCSMFNIIGSSLFQLKATGGQLYPGQSGGPVIDLTTKSVIGVNSAVTKDYILFAPTMGIRGTWGF